MSTATTEAGAAPRANRDATGERFSVAAMVSAICNLIEEHRGDEASQSARHVDVIATMIDDVATFAADGTATVGRRKRCTSSANCYEEVCNLGKGGFGVVFRARNCATGQDVAVKSLSRRCSSDILREACFMAACRGHPSVVGFLGVERAPGTKLDGSLVMEYAGQNLGAVLRDRGRPFLEGDVRRMMRQLLVGATVMHEHGIVHRDIKPENILVGDGGGTVKIGDFGLAISMYEKGAPFVMAGTNGYKAPELLLWNAGYDALVDMWSLGCVMAKLLTGELLFHGEDGTDQLYKIFDVVGVPGKKAWQALKPHQHLDDMVQQWRARQRRLGHRNRLRELFPEKMVSRDGFEVLKGLLTCDPKKRLTAAAALRCPWFTDNVDDPVVPAATAISTIDGVATKSWSSQYWRMAVSFAGRALELLRPKGWVK